MLAPAYRQPCDGDVYKRQIPMLRIIWKVCKWDEEKSYRISGTYHAECNLVVFDLKQAVTLMMNETE